MKKLPIIIVDDGKAVTLPEGLSTGSFVVGKKGILEAHISLHLDSSHEKYMKFLSQLKVLVKEYRGEGLITFASGL